MKKLFISIFVLLCLTGYSQTTIQPDRGWLLSGFDLSAASGTDTASQAFKFPNTSTSHVDSWGIQFKWYDLDTTGFGSHDTILIAYLQVSNFGYNESDFVYHPDSLCLVISDTTGSDVLQDNTWTWKYGRFLFKAIDTLGTEGKISGVIHFEPK